MEMIHVRKPTYYFWKSPGVSQEQFQRQYDLLKRCGFRIALYTDGPEQKDLRQALKTLIRNHWKDS